MSGAGFQCTAIERGRVGHDYEGNLSPPFPKTMTATPFKIVDVMLRAEDYLRATLREGA